MKSTFMKHNLEYTPQLSHFGQKDFYFTIDGRSALLCTLRSLNLPKGSKIGVPLYSCTIVFDAIFNAGYIPLFIDIDLNNYTISLEDLKDKISELSAIIVIHTFGRPAKMDEIKKISGDIPIIEDCSHALLSEYKGKLVGTIGSASVFSLAKYINSGGGGMIILNNNHFKRDLQKNIYFLSSSSILDQIKHCFFAYVYSTLYRKPMYGTITYPLGFYFLGRRDSNQLPEQISPLLIRKSDYAVFSRKINSFKCKVERQRQNSMLLQNELVNTSLHLISEMENTYCNYHLFPVRVDNKYTRDSIITNLRKNNIDSATLWHMTPTTAKKVYGYTGDCPNSELCADTLLTIPNYYSLKKTDLDYILLKLKENVI